MLFGCWKYCLDQKCVVGTHITGVSEPKSMVLTNRWWLANANHRAWQGKQAREEVLSKNMI